MGNNICCQESRTQNSLAEDTEIIKHPIQVEPKHPPVVHKPEPIKVVQPPKEVIAIPQLKYQVQKRVTEKKFFQNEFTTQTKHQVKRYGTDIYQGHLDEFNMRPNGLGKMYKPDGSIFIGHFNKGKAHGQGAYIFSDGSYYFGDFNNNQAESTNGEYISDTLRYKGGFKKNTFDGDAEEDGPQHKYKGSYRAGHRVRGILSWEKNKFTHVYEGPFNEKNQFHGKGHLKEPEGQYDGDFVNGEKQGNGIYHSANGTRYEGTYKNGFRSGFGTVYNRDNTIAYKGEMEKGMPHGRGSIFKNGKQMVAQWVEGVDANMLPSAPVPAPVTSAKK